MPPPRQSQLLVALLPSVHPRLPPQPQPDLLQGSQVQALVPVVLLLTQRRLLVAFVTPQGQTATVGPWLPPLAMVGVPAVGGLLVVACLNAWWAP